MDKQWYRVYTGQSWYSARFIGASHATLSEIKAACGPWHTVQGNSVLVYAPPPKAKKAKKG